MQQITTTLRQFARRAPIVRTLGGLACVVLAGTCLATVAPSASAQPVSRSTSASLAGSVKPLIGGDFHWIRNTGNSGLCLEPEGQSTDAGARIVQEPCVTTGLESVAQGWEAPNPSRNHYKFRNQLSGLCLDANDIFNGAAVIQWPCANISNQEFNVGTSLPAVAKIESRIHWSDTGFCVDEPGALGTIGAAMQMYQCNGSPAQIWINGF